MKDFFKTYPGIRIGVIVISFVIAIILTISGWKMAGEMAGLLRMIVGVAFLLVALKGYNVTFEDKKKKK